MNTHTRHIGAHYLLIVLLILKSIVPNAVAASVVSQFNSHSTDDVLVICVGGKVRYISASAYLQHSEVVDVELSADSQEPHILCPLEQFGYLLGADFSIAFGTVYVSPPVYSTAFQANPTLAFSRHQAPKEARAPPTSINFV